MYGWRSSGSRKDVICLILLAHPSCSELGFTSSPEWLENCMFPPWDAILWRYFSKYSFIILAGILWPNTWALSGALPSYPRVHKGKQRGLLPMCCHLPTGWLGLLRWLPFHRQQVWKWIGCVMGERAKGLWTLSIPTPEELLEGLRVLSCHLQQRAVILIMGLHWWMASWLHQGHAARNRPTGAGGGCPVLAPHTTVCRP